MAPRKKTTSASDRSKYKGKGARRVTGKTPQSRANRQKAGSAKVTKSGQPRSGPSARVTNSAQRTSTGRAKVTGGGRPALPPGRKGGPLVKPKTQTARQAAARTKAARAASGTKGGTRVGQPKGAANRMYGANVVNKAVRRATRSARLAKGAKLLKRGGRFAVGAYLADQAIKLLGRAASQSEWNKLSQEIKDRQNKGKPAKPTGGSSRRGQGSGAPAARRAAAAASRAAAAKPAASNKPKRQTTKKSGSSSSSTTTTRRAAAPAGAPKPKPKKLTDKQRMVGKSSAERLAVWARANRKMIEKSGTKKQREILANALKKKK